MLKKRGRKPINRKGKIKKNITIYVHEEDINLLQNKANEENKSITNYIQKIIDKDIKKIKKSLENDN